MRCRICENASGNTRHTAREMMFGTRQRFDYVECARCGCVQIETIPSDLAAYYPRDYYSFAVPPAPSRRGRLGRLRERRDRFAATGRGLAGRLAYALKPAPVLRSIAPIGIGPESRILDVGSGTGDVVTALYRAGFPRAMGIDPFLDGDVTVAAGPPVLRRSLESMGGEWDLIMFHHSFEHVPDPRATLRASAQRLAAGGVCLLRMPVASSYAWHHYGVDWVQLDPPRHLHVHTPTSVRILAEAAGLVLDEVVYDSTAFQFWASEQYRRDIPLRAPGARVGDPSRSGFSPKQIRRFAREAARLNARSLGDQAAFYLRRAHD